MTSRRPRAQDLVWLAAFVVVCAALVLARLVWFSPGPGAAAPSPTPAATTRIAGPSAGSGLASVWGTRPRAPRHFTDPHLVRPSDVVRRALAARLPPTSGTAWPDIANQAHVENVLGLVRACDNVEELTPLCVIGPTEGPDRRKVALLLGDDTMQAYWMMLRPIFASHGWTLVNDALTSCPAALTEPSPSQACRRHHTGYTGMLRHWRPSLVLMSDGEEALNAEYATGLTRTVTAARAAGARVLVLSPPPAQPSVVDCQQAHRSPQACAQAPYPTWFALNRVQREVAGRTGATYVDLLPFFCHGLVCPSIVPGGGATIAIRGDYAHLTPEYAQFVEASFAHYLVRRGLIR